MMMNVADHQFGSPRQNDESDISTATLGFRSDLSWVLDVTLQNATGTSAMGVRREKAALFQWVQIPPGDRSSRKQPEQAWRRRYVWCARKAGEFQPVEVRPG